MLKKLLLVASVLCVVLASSGSSQASHHEKVYFHDLFGGVTQHPKKIFFTANAGPWVSKMEWVNWGGRRTVGRGLYHDGSSVPCPPECNHEGWAKIVLKSPKRCKQPHYADKAGENLYMYTEGVLSHPDTETGETVVHSDISDYSTYCH